MTLFLIGVSYMVRLPSELAASRSSPMGVGIELKKKVSRGVKQGLRQGLKQGLNQGLKKD